MRFRRLTKWDDVESCAELIYFVQLVDEMLFDYSLDSYKTSVMHTGLLCMEALETIIQIEKNIIKQPNLKHVIEEFCAFFEKDDVAKSLVPIDKKSIFEILKDPKRPVGEIKTTIEIVGINLSLTKYKAKNEELLLKRITEKADFQEIRRLARSYITTLLAIGYDQKHINDVLLEFFYYGSNRIATISSISEFFALFPMFYSNFSVIFRASRVLEVIGDSTSELGLQVTRTLPSSFDRSKYPEFWVRDDEVFVIVDNIEATDTYSARSLADVALKNVVTLINLFHHKDTPKLMNECIVYNASSNIYKKISKPVNSMHKCADLLQHVANKRIKLFLTNFSLDRNSFDKFFRSAQLHSMALNSNSDENQILNLWISLESLIPSETKSDDSANIEHIISSITPFLGIKYFEDLLNNLVKDLIKWNRHLTLKALKGVDGKKFTDRLARILIIPYYSSNLALLENNLRDFHLLKDRIDYFKNMLASPSNVKSVLDVHKQRLEWQIRRIYRARNIIVHSGKTPSYTKQLIENIHNYLDTVLSTLVKLASEPRRVDSVSQGFKYTELQYKVYCKRLSENGLQFSRDNIDILLFNRL